MMVITQKYEDLLEQTTKRDWKAASSKNFVQTQMPFSPTSRIVMSGRGTESTASVLRVNVNKEMLFSGKSREHPLDFLRA